MRHLDDQRCRGAHAERVLVSLPMRHVRSIPMHCAGFTLIEMMVVVSVLAIMLSLAMPALEVCSRPSACVQPLSIWSAISLRRAARP